MGHVQQKYTKAYFLHQDEKGNQTEYGVLGVKEFEAGLARFQDKDLLDRVNFKGKKVLDIGFGRGEALKYAHDHGAKKVIGVDFSQDACKIAREFLNKYHVPAEILCEDAVTYIRDQAGKQTDKIDIVILLDVVEHIPRVELTQLFNELHTILTPNAVLLVNTPVFAVDNDVIAEGRIHPRNWEDTDDLEETRGMHCNRYTKQSLRRHLKACGYRAVAGHIFVTELSIPFYLEETRWAWEKAIRMGVPLKHEAIGKPELFEYAYSRKRRRLLERKLSYKILSFPHRVYRAILWRIGIRN